MSDYDELLSSVKELAIGLQALHQLAVKQLTPTVQAILRSRNRNVQHIERTLDRLLDHCCYEPALLLYRRLCRHYWEIDPVATVSYINSYREMWDTPDDPIEEQPPSMEVDPSRGDAELNVNFLLREFETAYLKLRRDSEEAGATKGAITCEQIGNLRIPVPPAAEQKAIVSQLDMELAKFDALTAEAERGIELLQERRTALISAAVTGKIDVRNFAESEPICL